MLDVFPGIYDSAASQLYKPADIPDKAVFYLHGQYTGFLLMNTPEECKEHFTHLGPVFEDAGLGRAWIVVGYSGANDPVFEHLAKVEKFDNNLYWIGYLDREPAEHVRGNLLVEGKYGFYVNGYDADAFFVDLTQRLGCFPPDFVKRPFTHLDRCLRTVVPNYTIPSQDSKIDVTREVLTLVREAIRRYEEGGVGEEGPPGQPQPGPTVLSAYPT